MVKPQAAVRTEPGRTLTRVLSAPAQAIIAVQSSLRTVNTYLGEISTRRTARDRLYLTAAAAELQATLTKVRDLARSYDVPAEELP